MFVLWASKKHIAVDSQFTEPIKQKMDRYIMSSIATQFIKNATRKLYIK